jgi:hypothetical protein
MGNEDGAKLEHVDTEHTDSPPGEKQLDPEYTLQHVDLENRHAYKGDDSDGKIEWTVRKLFACAFLAMLYTGIPFSSCGDKSLSG